MSESPATWVEPPGEQQSLSRFIERFASGSGS